MNYLDRIEQGWRDQALEGALEGDLKQVLTQARPGSQLLVGDHHLNPDMKPQGPYRDAAVLIPVVMRQPEPTMLLTTRAAHLSKHAGQISFPGGRTEPEDKDSAETALRETEEEIAVPRDLVRLVAELPPYLTRTGFRIYPHLGLVDPSIAPKPDPKEVADIFEVPLAWILDTKNHQAEFRNWEGKDRQFWAMIYGERRIWGATAGIIRNLSLLFGAME